MTFRCYRCKAEFDGRGCRCADGITLIHGDARAVLPITLACDALATDPPYGLNGGSGTISRRGKANLATWEDTVEDVREIYVPICRLGLALCAGRGAITPGTPNAFEYPKPDDLGCIEQPCATGVGRWGRATWQPVLFYGKDPRAGKHLDPTSLRLTAAAEKNGHPCPKPMQVVRWLVNRVSLHGETILDPFAGSGTTLRAAKDLGRRCIGIEIEEKYCAIAANRLRQEVLNFQEPTQCVEPSSTSNT